MSSSSIDFTRPAGTRVLEGWAADQGVPLWKRSLDLAVIILVSPILLPVGFLIALYIKCVSSGPVLFKQERVGYRERPFYCLKFRTMRVGSDTQVHQGHLQQLMSSNTPMVKLDAKGDKRLIRGGLILRSLGLDELPQLINVLCGEMSIVGPRPCIPYEFQQFLPWQRRRCDTLPGLTGWWQVNGKNRTTFDRMIELDLEYVRRKSLWFDLQIIFRTPIAILAQVWDVKFRRRAAASQERT